MSPKTKLFFPCLLAAISPVLAFAGSEISETKCAVTIDAKNWEIALTNAFDPAVDTWVAANCLDYARVALGSEISGNKIKSVRIEYRNP